MSEREGTRVKATGHATSAETGECRRLAELLNLDAVGIVRLQQGKRRVTWWAAPGSGPLPPNVDDVLEGRAAGWIACPRGEDVVFARLTPNSSIRSVSALAAMLSSLSGECPPALDAHRRGVAPEDPLAGERSRWAYAIHDGLTQAVTAAVIDLEWLARRVEVQPEEAMAALTEAAEELRKALDEIRGILSSLSPDASDTGEPLEELVRGVLERWRLPASWSIEGDLDAVPQRVLEAASSVIRESVANAAKHSSSRDVAIAVHASSTGMEVRVEDHGRGFRPSETGLHAGHLGMEMMRRRVAEVNGTLDIESSPGRGTRVVARLPVGQQGEKP